MRPRRDEVDDEVDDEDDGIVQDGHCVRVPIFAMDSMQLAIHDQPTKRETVMSNRALDYAARCLSRDHSSIIGNDAQTRLDDAYSEAEHALTNAWRSPGSTETPGLPTNDERHSVSDVEAAYVARDALLTSAWRSR